MVLIAGQADNKIRPQPAFLGVDALLFDEIAVFQHSGHFDHAAQLDFAPAPADLGPAQGLDQVRGLAAEQVLRFAHRFHLLGQSGVGFEPGFFDFLQFRIDFDQRFLDRLDQFVDGGLAFFQVALGRLVEFFQLFFGQFEERLIAVL